MQGKTLLYERKSILIKYGEYADRGIYQIHCLSLTKGSRIQYALCMYEQEREDGGAAVSLFIGFYLLELIYIFKCISII